jgi:hypothetical protein
LDENSDNSGLAYKRYEKKKTILFTKIYGKERCSSQEKKHTEKC